MKPPKHGKLVLGADEYSQDDPQGWNFFSLEGSLASRSQGLWERQPKSNTNIVVGAMAQWKRGTRCGIREGGLERCLLTSLSLMNIDVPQGYNEST